MAGKRLEQTLHLVAALVSCGAPFALDPVAAGFIFAALHIAIAVCIQFRRDSADR